MKRVLSLVKNWVKEVSISFWNDTKKEIKKTIKSFFSVKNLLIQLIDIAFVASFMLTFIGILSIQTFIAILAVYAAVFLITRVIKVKNMFAGEIAKMREGDLKNGNGKRRKNR